MMVVSTIGAAATALAGQVVAADEQGAPGQVGRTVRDPVVDGVQQLAHQAAVRAPVQVGVARENEQQSQPAHGRDPGRLVVVQVVGGGGRQTDGQDKVERQLVAGAVQPVECRGGGDQTQQRQEDSRGGEDGAVQNAEGAGVIAVAQQVVLPGCACDFWSSSS